MDKIITSAVKQKERDPQNTQILWNFIICLGVLFQPTLCWTPEKPFESGKLCLLLMENILSWVLSTSTVSLFCFVFNSFYLTSYCDSLRLLLFCITVVFFVVFPLTRKFLQLYFLNLLLTYIFLISVIRYFPKSFEYFFLKSIRIVIIMKGWKE